MLEHNAAPLHVILIVISLVLFGFAAFVWPPPIEAYRVRLIAAGLFFLVLASFF